MTAPAPTSSASSASPADRPKVSGPAPLASWGVLLGLVALMFLLRWSGPPNLTDNDQERPASYVMDAVRNGHWIVQRDWTGDITSKPPLYTWVAGLVALGTGVNTFALYLPCVAAVALSAGLIHRTTARVAGPRVALLAGFFVLANPLAAKLVALARTDPLFTATVTLTATLVFRAWQTGRGWHWAWIAAAFATLTKGPLGIVLGFAGLAALWRDRAPDRLDPPCWRRLLPGLGWVLLLAGGWFLAAWLEAGQALIDKMLKAELVNHAVGQRGAIPGEGLVLAPAYFLGRFAPWSAVALWSLWDSRRHPPAPPAARAWQRFAAAWLLIGLVVFGLASHQRGDLVAPLIPAGAVLAAFPVARWTAAWSSRRLLVVTAALGAAATVGFQIQHASRDRDSFKETRGLADLARRFRTSGGDPGAVMHVDAPYALQFYLGTMQRVVTIPEAAAALRAGRAHHVSVANFEPAVWERELGPDAAHLRTFLQWPTNAPARVRLLGFEASASPRLTPPARAVSSPPL